MFKRMFSKDKDKKEDKKEKKEKADNNKDNAKKDKPKEEKPKGKPESGGATSKPQQSKGGQKKGGGGEKKKGRRRRRRTQEKTNIDTSKPIDWPTNPEVIVEHNNVKKFLTKNEEWLLIEMNEFECMVENEEIIKIMAKASKFFEVDPPELLEEFFEWVDECPAYDEVINYDIWQEFTLAKYEC